MLLTDFHLHFAHDVTSKGLTGIRVDGVNNVHFDEVTISDMTEVTPPGLDVCGKYEIFDRDCVGKCGGHIRQKEPMQVGFSGHNLQGICLNAGTNVRLGKTNIHDLRSLYGLTYGVSIWPSVDITFEEKVVVSNLLAGVDYANILEKDAMGNIVYDDEETMNNYPNRIPEVCAIRVVEQYYSDTADKVYQSVVTFADPISEEEDVLIANVDGYKTCYVDSSTDDYYDNGAPPEKVSNPEKDRPPRWSMVGSWTGHDVDFEGIGEHGVMYRSRMDKIENLERRQSETAGKLKAFFIFVFF